jgi:hypothetical protein
MHFSAASRLPGASLIAHFAMSGILASAQLWGDAIVDNLHLILGGATVHRCDNCHVFDDGFSR